MVLLLALSLLFGSDTCAHIIQTWLLIVVCVVAAAIVAGAPASAVAAAVASALLFIETART